jgi:radical SAM protein with 4Fe4S-binding SPASM domain
LEFIQEAKMKGKQTFDSFDVLYIEVTGNCNRSCVHCGNEPGNSDLDFELIAKIMNEFNAGGGKKLILTGGEPLLHENIQEILALAASHDYNTKLSTNGVLLTDPRFANVLDMNIGFRVSLDGPKDIHNAIRRNPDTYDLLIAGMKEISAREKQLVIRTTVMRPNLDSIVQMLTELDRLSKHEGLRVYANNIWPMRGIGKANRELMLTPEEYKNFILELAEGTQYLNPDFRIIVGPTFGLESEFIGSAIQSNQIYKCDILNTSLHVGANGDVYPCSFVHYPLANIAEMSLSDVFRSEKAVALRSRFLDRNKHACEGCSDYEGCQAGCLADCFDSLLVGNPVKDIYCFRGETE